jgi:exodeoxyribonuclease V beta subunit
VRTFVHEVLEALNFAAPDLGAELIEHVARAQARRRVDIGDEDAVVTGLRAMLETPLGQILRGERLCDVARADRLEELTFELPPAAASWPGGRPAGSSRRSATSSIGEAPHDRQLRHRVSTC